jgi:hypothetical protein
MRHVAIVVVTGVILLVGTASAKRPAMPPTGELALDLIATPPHAPRVERLRIQVEPSRGERAPVVSLTFVPRDVGPEATAFELAISDDLGRQALAIPHDTTFLYRPELQLMKQRVRVEVRAIDAYGARSQPTTVDVDVDQQYRCGLGPMLELVFRAFVALVLTVLFLIAIRCARRTPPVAFAP